MLIEKASQKTQRKKTFATYEKISNDIGGKHVQVLDYGAGLTHGTDLLRSVGHTVCSYEPNPQEGITPSVTDAKDIIGNYDAVINMHVLNVIADPEIRTTIIKDILTRTDKTAYFVTRSHGDVMGAKNYVLEGDGIRLDNGSFQRGFNRTELRNLIQSVADELMLEVDMTPIKSISATNLRVEVK